MVAENRPFVHLRTHSAYSILEGALQLGRIKDLCIRNRMPAIALTDTNNLFGALEFSEKLAGAGIQPIVGLTIAVHLPGGPPMARSEPDGNLALLSATETGYQNLMKLASQIWLESDPAATPSLALEDVLALHEGVIALTGGPDGVINKLIVADHADKAEAVLEQLHEVYGDRFYVELQRHGLADEHKAEGVLIDWAYANGVPLVATHEPYFAESRHHRAHDALLCIAGSTYVSVEDRRKLTPRHYFTSSEEMAALFADLPEALENTVHIAMRCGYRPHTHGPILPPFESDTGLSEVEELRSQAVAGLQARLQSVEPAAEADEYEKRLQYELGVIEQMGFPGYFLIVSDFIKWAKSQGIPVGPGRGSGAGSVVAWALTITDLDPIRFNLLFERFLNPERVSMPDFDIDFCQERRGEVIDYVRKKYGRDHVAQIITFGTLQARAALRDVGRVMQLPYGQVDRLARMVPSNPADPVSLAEAVRRESDLRNARAEDEDVAMLLDTAMELEGLIRNASTHAAGVVIGDRPLTELTPLYLDPRSDIQATQFNMKWVEKAGLVKFDFLGLKTLTVIARAVNFIRQKGVDLNLSEMPLDDADTYKLMRDADTVGIFQLESTGMRDTLRKAQPDCFEDIIAIIALYRPGPMDNIPKFVACKFGREEPIHLHDKITPVVADTYGIIIYQEQVMQIAQVLAGYSLGEADLLRRAMGKKIKEEMAAQRERFVRGAMENDVGKARANEIFDIVDKFAGYGFNKSHSAAYALVGYHTAWLKAHHPVEFFAASMSLDLTNTDKLSMFLQDARQHGIKVLPPDVNHSGADFTVKDGELVYALGAIKNVGLSAMQHVVDVREEGGPFEDLYDFANRVDPTQVNRRAMENLAKAGAFGSLESNGRKVLESVPALLAASTSAARERAGQQESLFGDEGLAVGRQPLPDIAPWSEEERMGYELESIGSYLSGHPLDARKAEFAKMNLVSSGQAMRMAREGKTGFRMVALIKSCQERVSQRSGRKFGYLQCSDPDGEFEMFIPPKILLAERDKMQAGEIRILSVRAELREGEARLYLDALESLESAASRRLKGLRVQINDGAVAKDIRQHMDALSLNQNAVCGELTLLVQAGDGDLVEMMLGGRWPMDVAAQSALQGIPGVESVEEVSRIN